MGEPRLILPENRESFWPAIRRSLAHGAVFPQVHGLLINNFLTLRRARRSRLRAELRVLNVELTNCCNHRCRFCLTGIDANPRPKGKLDLQTFRNLTEHVRPGTVILFAGYGEPFLNENTELFLDHARRQGLIDHLDILSNFSAISGERIHGILDYPFRSLIISLDSMSRETFKAYRGCDDFDLVFNNIRILADQAKKRKRGVPRLIVQMVVTRKNAHERQRFVDTIRAMDLIPRLKTLNTQSSFADDRKTREFEVSELSRYGHAGYRRTCMWVWGGMMVLWNGDVTICCQDAGGSEVYGNVNRQDIMALLNRAEGRCAFRERYFRDPSRIKICRACDGA